MNRFGFRRAALAVLALGFLSVFPTAAQSPFALFPESAPVVVKIPGLDSIEKNVGGFLSAAVPDQAAKLLAQMKGGIAAVSQGRDLKGIDKSRPVYAILADLKTLSDNDPAVGLVVPVTKFDDLKASFTEDELKSLKDEDGLKVITLADKPVYLIDKGNAVFASPSKSLAKDYAGKFTSMGGKVGADIEKSFVASDLAVYVSMVEINKLYGAQIQGVKGQIDFFMGLAGGQIDKKQAEMIKDMVVGLLQIVEDGKSVLIGMSFHPEGASLKLQSDFGKETPTASFLKDAKPSALASFGDLPAGQSTYSGIQMGSKLGKMLSKLGQQMIAEDADEDVKAKLSKLADAMVAAGAKDLLSFANFDPVGGLNLSSYEKSADALTALTQTFQTLTENSSFGNMPLKSKPTVKVDAEKAAGLSFTRVQVDFDFDKMVGAQNIPEEMKDAMKAMMKKMLSGESTVFWLAKDGDKVLQITAKDWAGAEKIAAQYAGMKAKTLTLGATDAFKVTRAGLPAEATVLGLLETNSLIAVIYEYAKSMSKMIPGADAVPIPELKLDKTAPKSFFGFSATLKPEFGGFDIFVPAATVKAIAQVVRPLLNQGD